MKRAASITVLLAIATGIVSATPQAAESHPVSMAVVLDTSGSMRAKMTLAHDVLTELINRTSSRDEIALIEASDHPVVLSGFENSADVLLNYQWYFIPVFFFIALVMAFVFVGDGLGDAADPYGGQKK